MNLMKQSAGAVTTRVTSIYADAHFDGVRAGGPVVVALENGCIGAVRTEVPPGQPADLRVRYLMPGLIDAHVHATGYREGIPAGNPYGPAKHFLRLCLARGVTTVRDVGNSLEALYYAREWCERYPAPRIFGSGPLLDGSPFTWPFSRHVFDEASAQWHVDQLAGAGVDLVKTYARLAEPLVKHVVRAASSHGLPVAAHCGATTARQAAEAGVRSVEHAEELLDEELAGPLDPRPHDPIERVKRWAGVDPDGFAAERLVEAFSTNGTALCPTLLVSRRWCFLEELVGEPNNDRMVPVMPYHAHLGHARGTIGLRIASRYMARYMPVRALARGERPQVEEGLARMSAVVRRLARSGVPIVAGTDTPNPSVVPGHALHQELHLLRAAGLANVEVLAAATSAAAKVIGDASIGVIRPGACADLLLLDDDPVEDLHSLARIAGVVRRGELVDLEALEARIQRQMEASR